MKTIYINMTDEHIDKMGEATDPEKVSAAINRLMRWGSYPIVSIHMDGDHDMIAVYKDTESQPYPSFVISAVWHGDRYGFHS